jgi:phosphatidylserine decarboxylase
VRIAREGWPVIAMAAGVLGVVGVVGTLAGHPASLLPLVLGVGFCLYFFRDPERQPPPGEGLVVSPADGRVLAVAPGREERFLGAPATRISIFMSPLDVHVNRTPVSGTVAAVRHSPGRFRAAFSDKSSLDNEHNTLVIDDGGGRRYLLVQIAGALARRIVCRVGVGDRVRRGERFGLIMFGSRVDFFLPAGVEARVGPGDRVRAGSSVVAEVSA